MTGGRDVAFFIFGKKMRELWNILQAVFTGIGGWPGYFLGGCNGLLYALIAFTVTDYISGVMCGIVDQKLSSSKGICRKVVVFMLVGVATILDTRIFQTGSVLRTAVIFFYLSNEGISLLENAAHLGMSRMSDDHDGKSPGGERTRRGMDARDKRTGGIHHPESPHRGLAADGGADSVGGEKDRQALGDAGE